MEITRWKLVAGGTALAGFALGGVAAASADDGGLDLNDRRPAIALTEPAADDSATAALAADGSPESADSPNNSVHDSTDSPFDSADDPGWVDPSPESADSPHASAQDSPPPPPPPPPAPEPAPAESADSPAPVPAPAWDSADSPDSGDSDD